MHHSFAILFAKRSTKAGFVICAVEQSKSAVALYEADNANSLEEIVGVWLSAKPVLYANERPGRNTCKNTN